MFVRDETEVSAPSGSVSQVSLQTVVGANVDYFVFWVTHGHQVDGTGRTQITPFDDQNGIQFFEQTVRLDVADDWYPYPFMHLLTDQGLGQGAFRDGLFVLYVGAVT